MKTLLAVVVVSVSACGPTGGVGDGGTSMRREYAKSVHVVLTVNESTVQKDSGGTVILKETSAGTFEGNSSKSRSSGVNMVYEFENSIDQFANASFYRKSCAGAGPCDEHTDTVTAITLSSFAITVGPTSFNAQTGELFGPFNGFSYGDPGVKGSAGTTTLGFNTNIPRKLDSRCAPDANVKMGNIMAIDGDAYSGFTIRQTYTCTADTTVFTYENAVQVSAL